MNLLTIADFQYKIAEQDADLLQLTFNITSRIRINMKRNWKESLRQNLARNSYNI